MGLSSKQEPPELTGISIINGAQTTGSIGSIDLKKYSLNGVKVLCRVIECTNQSKIEQIVKYNNTQNEIMAWDQYSNDPEQRRLGDELKEFGFAYNRKRGFQIMGDQVGIEEVVQPLLAFHGRPQDAVRGKNDIFDSKLLYKNAFENKKGRHILLVHTLAKAVDQKRLDLKNKSNNNHLIEIEEQQLALLRHLRFKAFLIAVTSKVPEAVVGKVCDSQTVAFTANSAKNNTIVELIARWSPIVDSVLAFLMAVDEVPEFSVRLSEEIYMIRVTRSVTAFLTGSKTPSQFSGFGNIIGNA